MRSSPGPRRIWLIALELAGADPTLAFGEALGLYLKSSLQDRPKSSTGSGRISDRRPLERSRRRVRGGPMEIQSLAGASRDSLPASTQAPTAAVRLSEDRPAKGSAAGPGSATAISRRGLYSTHPTGYTTPELHGRADKYGYRAMKSRIIAAEPSAGARAGAASPTRRRAF